MKSLKVSLTQKGMIAQRREGDLEHGSCPIGGWGVRNTILARTHRTCF